MRVKCRSYLRIKNVLIHLIKFLAFAAETAKLQQLLEITQAEQYALPKREVNLGDITHEEKDLFREFVELSAKEYEGIIKDNQKELSAISKQLEVWESKHSHMWVMNEFEKTTNLIKIYSSNSTLFEEAGYQRLYAELMAMDQFRIKKVQWPECSQ